MPTYFVLQLFWNDYPKLSAAEKALFCKHVMNLWKIWARCMGNAFVHHCESKESKVTLVCLRWRGQAMAERPSLVAPLKYQANRISSGVALVITVSLRIPRGIMPYARYGERGSFAILGDGEVVSQWARKHVCYIDCETIERPYLVNERCKRCYDKWRYKFCKIKVCFRQNQLRSYFYSRANICFCNEV